MLKVQSWLQANNGQFDLLEKQLGIKSTFHPDDDRVILNYCQIDSPKQHEIVRETRGLVLNRRNYDIIARSFERFFNAGEMLDLHKNFVWERSEALDKEDGSLILTYMYNGEPHLNTRGSFGHGEINSSGISWRMLMEMAVPNWKDIQTNFPSTTLVWELCSRYNKVVRDYPTPTAYLLSAFVGQMEYQSSVVDTFAADLNLNRPGKYTFSCLDEVMQFIAKRSENDPTYEGLVLRDINGIRMKIKSSSYILLHKTVNNYALTNERIIDIILTMGIDEFLVYYPELENKVRPIDNKIKLLHQKIKDFWPKVQNIPNQKEFALAINHLPFKGILFQARKFTKNPVELLTVQNLLPLI